MKVIIFSDAHGNKEVIKRVIEFNPDADYVISLGDSELPHSFLLDLDIVAIKGNYPRDGGFVFESILEVEGKRLFLTHGHKFGVSKNMRKLLAKGMETEVDIVLYGHTHIPKFDNVAGVFYMNPGSIYSPRSETPASYLILNIEKDKDVTYMYRESATNLLIENV